MGTWETRMDTWETRMETWETRIEGIGKVNGWVSRNLH